ncbi:MAG: hypothetical protein EOM29_10845 [Bacteroidia bacterium]|nr:hypothetical protein [Bacteroidia bacterium]
MKDKIREICTFHDKDGTSGYLLDEQRFDKIFELLDEKQEKSLGLMRQWLNEERITDPQKMVTNEDLKIWFK